MCTLSRHVSSLGSLLFLLVTFLNVLPRTTAMIDTNVTFQLPSSTWLYYVDNTLPHFTFSSSGNFYLSVTLLPPHDTPSNYSIQVLFCSSAALSRMGIANIQNFPFHAFCPDWDLSSAECEWRVLLGENDKRPTGVVWTATETSDSLELTDDDYTLYIMNCGAWNPNSDFHYSGNDVSVMYTFIAQSKPGEYLSLTHIPYKSLYAVASALWVVLLVVWAVHCWRWRAFNIGLQLTLLAVPISKAWLGVPFTAAYLYASSHGYSSQHWLWVVRISELVDEVVFFTVLILIAKGWRILHAEFTTRWKRQYAAYMALLIGASVMWQYGNRTITSTVLVVAYLLLFQYVFTSVMANTLSIVNTVQAFRPLTHVDPSTLPLWSKLHMYKLYQLALVLYFSISLITYLCASFFLKSLPWVRPVVEQLLALLLGVAVGHGLWLRPFNPYWYWITMLYAQRGEQGGDAGLASQHGAPRAHDEHGSERRGRASRRSSADRGEHDERSRESAGRRALRQQNQDMRSSLLQHDYLDQPRGPPSPSLSDSSSLDSSSLLLWQPGMPLPPFPVDPKQWLITAEEEDAPLLVVHQPDGSIVLGQYASDVPCKVAIPDEALRFFPDELVDMLYEADEDEAKHGEDADDGHWWRHRRRTSELDRGPQRHTATASAAAGGVEDERMATSSPAVRRVSSPSQYSFSSSRHRVSDAPHSSVSGSSESDSWRGADDEDSIAGGASHELSRAVSMQQLGDADKSGVASEEEEKKDGGSGGGQW